MISWQDFSSNESIQVSMQQIAGAYCRMWIQQLFQIAMQSHEMGFLVQQAYW